MDNVLLKTLLTKITNSLTALIALTIVFGLLSLAIYYYAPLYDLHIEGDNMFLLNSTTGEIQKCETYGPSGKIRCR